MRRLLGRGVLGAYRGATRVWAKAFSLGIAGSFASFGARTVVQPPLRVHGERRISIGDDVFLGAGCWLQALDGHSAGIAIEIGNGTSIVGGCVLSAAVSVRLGRSVLIARNVYIADHGHAFEDTDLPVLAQGLRDIAPVEIDDGAWLGENVVVCPGVRIGRGAVVGANAVVLHDVPDYAVAVGAPARVVRGFSPSSRAEPLDGDRHAGANARSGRMVDANDEDALTERTLVGADAVPVPDRHQEPAPAVGDRSVRGAD